MELHQDVSYNGRGDVSLSTPLQTTVKGRWASAGTVRATGKNFIDTDFTKTLARLQTQSDQLNSEIQAPKP